MLVWRARDCPRTDTVGRKKREFVIIDSARQFKKRKETSKDAPCQSFAILIAAGGPGVDFRLIVIHRGSWCWDLFPLVWSSSTEEVQKLMPNNVCVCVWKLEWLEIKNNSREVICDGRKRTQTNCKCLSLQVCCHFKDGIVLGWDFTYNVMPESSSADWLHGHSTFIPKTNNIVHRWSSAPTPVDKRVYKLANIFITQRSRPLWNKSKQI